MQNILHSKLLRLDLSNDQLLQMYNILYYDLPIEEKETADNLCRLIELREKIQLELRRQLFNVRNSVQEFSLEGAIRNLLPDFLKIAYLARNTFNNTGWELCYKKENKNLKLYCETLYNQELSTDAVENLMQQKKSLKSIFE